MTCPTCAAELHRLRELLHHRDAENLALKQQLLDTRRRHAEFVAQMTDQLAKWEHADRALFREIQR